MEVGIQISSLKPLLMSEQQVKAAFQKIAAVGCRTVQLQWIDPLVPISVIIEALEDAKLQSISVQDFYETIRSNPEYYIKLNQQSGGIWMCVSRIPERLKTVAGLQKYVTELREFQMMLDPYGQQLCFHPVSADYQLIEGIEPVEYLIEQMPEMMIALDLYHLNRSGYNMPEWILKHRGRICMVHYKDAIGEKLVPTGQGDVDWRGVTAACIETGIPYAFAEQEQWDHDPYECLKEAMEWIRKEIKKENE